jgi:hypothetical protein
MDPMSETIDRWRRIYNRTVGEKAWKASSAEVPPDLFHAFRPSGAGLEEIFDGVARGTEILGRLKEVFRVGGRNPEDWYFLVRDPAPASRDRIVELVRKDLAGTIRMARVLGQDDLVELGDGAVEVDVTESPPPDRAPTVFHPLELALHEIAGDFVAGLEPEDPVAHLLREPLYQMACTYDLVRHVLWPLYRGATPIREPFEAAFELWTFGAKVWFDDEHRCHAHVPRLG